jgi:FAD/FMN-containing dehydrogenase
MVGVAGLTLGGGYGLFSRQHGLTCDSLLGLRIVDGTGKVHDIADGSDLFWACRGGGNGHFGVVTQLRFDTVSAPRRMWRHVFRAANLTPPRAASLAETWFALAAELPNEAFSAFVLNHRRLTVLVTSALDGEPPSVTRALRKLEATMDQRVARLQEELMPGIRRYYGKLSPLYFKNASAGYYRGYDDIRPAALRVFEIVGQTPELLFQINTLGGAIDNSAMTGKTAYAHRSYGFLGEIQSYWDEPKREQTAIDAVTRAQRLLKTAGVRAHYCNYPDIEFSDWVRSYYGEQGHERLLTVKKAYDPDRLFRYPQSIGAT